MQGQIVSGLGQGSYYVSREGYKKQFKSKLGFQPFPGTLNLKLDGPFLFQNYTSVEIEGFQEECNNFGRCSCYKIIIEGINAAIIRPHRSTYPADMVEIIAPVFLRKLLQISEGDYVNFIIDKE